jgi:uncharacterized delta-60 repeat protein
MPIQEQAMFWTDAFRSRHRQCRNFRPKLEVLEDRCTPAFGGLDPTFGQGGIATTDFFGYPDLALAMTIQPADGAVVVAGATINPNTKGLDFGVARYDSTGKLDNSFSNDGKQNTSLGDAAAFAVAEQQDGKILVAGAARRTLAVFDSAVSVHFIQEVEFAMARYLPNGALDTSFGPDHSGMVFTDFSNDAEAVGIAVERGAVEQDESIILGGVVVDKDSPQGPSQTGHFALARYDMNGNLQSHYVYGNGTEGMIDVGKSNFSFGLPVAMATSVLSGKIILTGARNGQIVVKEFKTDGTPDDYFGGMNAVTTFVATDAEVESAAIQPLDGAVLVGGATNGGTFLARFLPNGDLDMSFVGDGSANGIVRTKLGQATSIAVGYLSRNQQPWIAVAGGSVVQVFFGDGSVAKAFGYLGAYTINSLDLHSVAIQSDLNGEGDLIDVKIVAAGLAESNANSAPDFAVVRLLTGPVKFNPALIGALGEFAHSIHFNNAFLLGGLKGVIGLAQFNQFMFANNGHMERLIISLSRTAPQVAEFLLLSELGIRFNVWVEKHPFPGLLASENIRAAFRTWLDTELLHDELIALGANQPR